MLKRILALLEKSEKISYLESELYLVDAPAMKALMNLKINAQGLIRCVGEKAVDYNYTEPIKVKLLNPSNPCYKYTLAALFTPRTITNPDKVYELLSKEFEVWKNVRQKALKKELKDNEYSQKRADEVRMNLTKEIDKQKARLEYLMSEYDRHEVFITTYEDAKKYPSIYMNFKDQQKKTENLSIRAINVLWYSPDIQKSAKRSDASILERISNSSKIGSTIYYKEKSEE